MGGARTLRPISGAGARPAARGRWRTQRAAWGSGPRARRWAGAPRAQPATLRGARGVPRGARPVTCSVPRRLRTGRWTGGAGSRRVRKAGHMRGPASLGPVTARCLTPGVVLRSRESRDKEMEGIEAAEETGETADARAGRTTSPDAGGTEGRQR